MAGRVSEATQALLKDLQEWGAEDLDTLRSRLGTERFDALEAAGFIRCDKTTHGQPFVVIGSEGRRMVNIMPLKYKVTGDAAAIHLKRREARTLLKARGYTFDRVYDRTLFCFRAPNGERAYLAVSSHVGTSGFSVRNVNRLLARYTDLLQGGDKLIVGTSAPYRLNSLAARHPDVLIVLPLEVKNVTFD